MLPPACSILTTVSEPNNLLFNEKCRNVLINDTITLYSNISGMYFCRPMKLFNGPQYSGSIYAATSQSYSIGPLYLQPSLVPYQF